MVVVLPSAFHNPHFFNRKLPRIFVAGAHGVLNHSLKKGIGVNKLIQYIVSLSIYDGRHVFGVVTSSPWWPFFIYKTALRHGMSIFDTFRQGSNKSLTCLFFFFFFFFFRDEWCCTKMINLLRELLRTTSHARDPLFRVGKRPRVCEDWWVDREETMGLQPW